MSWDWVSGHIKVVNQFEVIESIKASVAEATQNRLRFVDKSKVEATTLSQTWLSLLTFISYEESDWLTLWTESRRFATWLYRLGKFSGILFHGHDELVGDSAFESWDYTLWDKGNIASWYISNPKFEFQEWGLEALEDVLIPYLVSKGISIHIDSAHSANRYRIILDTIAEISDIFQPDILSLLSQVSPQAPGEVVSEWHTLCVLDAMYEIPHVFKLPFAGPDYNIVDMAVYLDIVRDKISAPQDLYYLDISIPEQQRYNREASWKDAVSQFEPLLLEPLHEDVVHQELAHIFFYQ